MAQLNLKLTAERIEGLKRYAARRRTPVSWLIKDYIDYLLRGGAPVPLPDSDLPAAEDLAVLAEAGGAFNWLNEEPELYLIQDGEPL